MVLPNKKQSMHSIKNPRKFSSSKLYYTVKKLDIYTPVHTKCMYVIHTLVYTGVQTFYTATHCIINVMRHFHSYVKQYMYIYACITYVYTSCL